MTEHRAFNKIVLAITAVAVALCLAAIGFSDRLDILLGGQGVAMDYEEKLFDTDQILDVSISIDEADWSDLLENAINEEYYTCDVTVNGETFSNVGIRAKGNTSLSQVASDPDTDRYSFKLEFDHYDEGQSCYGLDKLILNNAYADATNMKEAIVYDMFAYLDADASLYNYAKISVNGAYWGVYLALEGVEDSFLTRNYGADAGELYKPDSMNFGGAGGMKDRSETELNEIAEKFFGDTDTESDSDTAATEGANTDSASEALPEDSVPSGQSDDAGMTRTAFTPGNMPGNGSVPGEMPDMEGFDIGNTVSGEMPEMSGAAPSAAGGMGGGAGGSESSSAALNYIDDDLDSYSTIWEGEVKSTGKADHKRVVSALKQISARENLTEVMDVDNLLRYMAVHTFAVNLDSLSGSMAHNYYLYEQNGKLNLIPWDYNLSWGGFTQGGGSASSTVNFPIDTPFSSGISMEDRDFFAALLENEEYLAQYHAYLQELCDYVNGGTFSDTYTRIREQIDGLVETDPTAFYTYDEFETACDTLVTTLALRAESVEGQLNGTVPATTQGQSTDPDALIDTGDLNLSLMGSMGGGNDRGENRSTETAPAERNQQNEQDGSAPAASGEQSDTQGNAPAMPEGQSDTQGNMPAIPEGQSDTQGNMPAMPEGQSDTQGNMPAMPEGQSDTQGNAPAMPEGQSDTQGNMPTMPEGQSSAQGNMPTMPDGQSGTQGNMPTMPGGQSDAQGNAPTVQSGQSGTQWRSNALLFGGCALLMGLAILLLSFKKRKKNTL